MDEHDMIVDDQRMTFDEFKKLAEPFKLRVTDERLHELYDAAQCALDAWIEKNPDAWAAECERARERRARFANANRG